MSNEQKNGDYDDIIDLPHHASTTRPRMSRLDRAAQFAPFAALTGYGAAIKETARLTDERSELGEYELMELNAGIHMLMERIDEHPQERKDGGAYLTVKSRAKRLNEYERFLLLEDGTEIPFDDIYKIELCAD